MLCLTDFITHFTSLYPHFILNCTYNYPISNFYKFGWGLIINCSYLLCIGNRISDQNDDSKCKNDKEAQEYLEFGEGTECGNDILDSLREDEGNELEISDEDNPLNSILILKHLISSYSSVGRALGC